MPGAPICHGVVRWKVLLHQCNRLAIGCTVWPVIGFGPGYHTPAQRLNVITPLRNS